MTMMQLAEHRPFLMALLALVPTSSSTKSATSRAATKLLMRLVAGNEFARHVVCKRLVALGADVSDSISVVVVGGLVNIVQSMFTCDGCECDPITGPRFSCLTCLDKDYCGDCRRYKGKKHVPEHPVAQFGCKPFPAEVLAGPEPARVTATELPSPMWAKHSVPAENMLAYPFEWATTSLADQFVPTDTDDGADSDGGADQGAGGGTADAEVSVVHRAGFLTKMGGSTRSWRRRWVVLDGTQLSYFKNKQQAERGREPIKTWHIVPGTEVLEDIRPSTARQMTKETSVLKRMWVPTSPSKGSYDPLLGFKLPSVDRTFLFHAEDGDRDREGWLASLRDAVKLAAIEAGPVV